MITLDLRNVFAGKVLFGIYVYICCLIQQELFHVIYNLQWFFSWN